MRSTPSSPCARSRTIAHASRTATTTEGIVQASQPPRCSPPTSAPIPARSPATVIGSIARSTRWRARSIELVGGSVVACAGRARATWRSSSESMAGLAARIPAGLPVPGGHRTYADPIGPAVREGRDDPPTTALVIR